MKYPLFCVRDKIQGFQAAISVDMNEQSAYRGFDYAVNNNGLMNFKPADYDLYKIGEFDTESGEIEAVMPQFIVNGASVYNEKQKRKNSRS